jgi:hypothetical protein
MLVSILSSCQLKIGSLEIIGLNTLLVKFDQVLTMS